jgi:hypothetical protein
MAAQPVAVPPQNSLEIDEKFRELLHLRETETHYITQSYAGVTIEHPKSDIKHAWQLLGGILAGGHNPNEERELEKQRELMKDAEWFRDTP